MVYVHQCGYAIAALVTALVSPIPISIALGHIALRRIRNSNGTLPGRGMAVAGLVLGYLWLAWWLFFIIAVKLTA